MQAVVHDRRQTQEAAIEAACDPAELADKAGIAQNTVNRIELRRS